jgi:hypothetical protein
MGSYEAGVCHLERTFEMILSRGLLVESILESEELSLLLLMEPLCCALIVCLFIFLHYNS